MNEIVTIGIDLAKNVFQIHGVDAAGAVVLRRKLRRSQVLAFFASLEPCLIGMEACAGAHFWARELTALGHETRLMPAAYVKPYVKRGKTDAADAEAICEAAGRPTMRFVPVKSAERQAGLLDHKAREFLVRQRTQIVNVIRAHLSEFGIVIAKGIHNIDRLLATAEKAPEAARPALAMLADQLRDTHDRIATVTARVESAQARDPLARRLASVPGIGAITASALAATTPDVDVFRTGRDYAAWLGLTPKAHSSGGKERLGGISKAGNRYLRRLLYLGAMSRISARRGKEAGTDWLSLMLGRKPVKLVAVALANRMARIVWALIRSGERYRAEPA